ARLSRTLPADQSRRRVRRVVSRRVRLGRRCHRQPRRVVSLLVRDSRRARAVACADRRGAPVEHRRPGGLAAPLRARRPGCETRHWQGARWLPRGARVPCETGRRHVNPRIDRLQMSLDEPLLVTNPINIYYLFGFKSSNAALLVDDSGVRLFTDFRYAEAARGVGGGEFQETRRALLWDLSSRLSGPIGFEADYVSYGGYETLSAGSIEPVPRRGLVERLRAVKDEEELAAIRRACEITDRMFERLSDERFTGRSEHEI